MSTQRRHPKTRAGCVPCKQRRIKCDETTPSCRHCQRRKLTCSFLRYVPLKPRPHSPSPTSPPNNALLGLPLQFKILDLELLHFYTTTTSLELLGPHMTGTPIWRTSVVTISFAFPFLLHGLFSLSALHLVYLYSNTNPDLAQKYNNIATLHHLKCIADYRLEIQNLRPENSDACCACASLLAVHAWYRRGSRGADLFFADEGLSWYKLHRGGAEILQSAISWVQKGALSSMIRPLMVLESMFPVPSTSLVLVDIGDDIDKLNAISSCWGFFEEKDTLDSTLQTLRFAFNLTSHLSSKSGTELKGSISSCIATLSWMTLVPLRFCEMVEEKCPQALILVAVYCILLKRIEGFWWIEGKAESLLEAVEGELGDGWQAWLEWPRREVETGAHTPWK
ncbi:uncharacterized protein LY89DRAFT_243869 [Mollisia scopiformis]|uniref:Zn(2)-C6 fungal-type domain-containing protein n=1 Tax=Mollisia scopiformis TaxID=149040 RepID=A0A194WUP7_MOLSC|nr:uncharacterized protein LY89DRAFT_243869 [Mollisia scopiformis]KUJ11394.1 hypothetical protein LY89DRAFT_243869 [Mollisia scopiformis]